MTTEPTDAELESAWTEATGSSILPYPDDMLAFARAVLARWGQPSGAGEPVAWKHDCAALLTNGVELWIGACPHCGKPHTTAPQPTQAVPPVTPWKDHQTATLVNELRDCAKEFHGTQQLRERLLHILGPMIDWVRAAQAVPPAGREPLKPDQIAEIADAAHREYDRLVSSGQCAPRWSAVFAYLLERHHGIGIKGKEAGNADT